MIDLRRSLSGHQWVHVYNRGVSRRPLFERVEDFRFFRRCLGLTVRRTENVEVHAFCQLTNHFHLLLRADSDSLSSFMHRLQSVYARWFNEQTGRRGPLMEGRFGAVPIRSMLHWRTVLRYIDANPVEAGLAIRATDYQHCSAPFYTGGHAPKWLTRDAVIQLACERAGTADYGPASYLEAFPPLTGDGFASVHSVMVRTRELRSGPYLSTLPPPLRAAFLAAIENADGGAEALDELVVPPRTLIESVARTRDHVATTTVSRGRCDPWIQLSVGLLHEASGCRGSEIASLMQLSQASVSRVIRRHVAALAQEPYRRVRAIILRRARRTVFS